MRKLLVAAALAAFATPALAQSEADAPLQIPGGGPPGRQGGDERGPGEHGPRGRRLFVSPSGEPFRGGGGLEAWFAEADADHDGAVTLAEFQADALRAFRLYDTNGDGVIDGFEIQAYERDRVPDIAELSFGGEDAGGRGGRRRRGGGMGGGPDEAADGRGHGPLGAGREGAARYSLLNEPEPLLAADEDVDGKVSLAEWTHATARRFAKLDKDHSGRLTLAGLRRAPARR